MVLSSMSPRERLMAVCRHEMPDRIPFLLISREFGLRYSGVKHSRAYEDPDAYVGAQLRLLADFQVEGVKTNLPLHRRIVASEAFARGELDTGFLSRL